MANLRILQLNGQRCYGVMSELGDCMLRERLSICLLQEPYVRNGVVVGLPSAMRAYVSMNGGAAIVVNDRNSDVIPVPELTDEYGVCLWFRNTLFEGYMVSVYCQYSMSLEPYLGYLERVLSICGNKPILFGLDVNATSSLWHSKRMGTYGVSVERGLSMEEFIIEKGLIVANQVSECKIKNFTRTSG